MSCEPIASRSRVSPISFGAYIYRGTVGDYDVIDVAEVIIALKNEQIIVLITGAE